MSKRERVRVKVWLMFVIGEKGGGSLGGMLKNRHGSGGNHSERKKRGDKSVDLRIERKGTRKKKTGRS